MQILRVGLTGTALVIVCGCGPKPAPPASMDGRTPLVLPAEAAEAVRAEMRTMLGSLNEIHQAIAARDTALAHRAAVASGLAAAADPELEPLLPENFMRLGVATHSQFDSVALAISAGTPAESLVSRLPGLTANCVSCHAIYRLAVVTESQ